MLFSVLPIFFRIDVFFGISAAVIAALTARPAAIPMEKPFIPTPPCCMLSQYLQNQTNYLGNFLILR